MYAGTAGDIFHPLSSFYDIYADIVVSYAHEVNGIYGIYVIFEGHICCWHMYSYSMVNKVAFCCF